jgi:lipopolysaccharide transport system ATP-binding protein
MGNTVIKVENLSKSYTIRHQDVGNYTALRDVIASKAKSIFKKKLSNINYQSKEKFWALKDVSFEINHGDRLGVIGRNGAGKSTLLKILSRIVSPTTGRITLDGLVSSLLEVGTGFHGELTGRENIFLNGSILGMSRSEIKSKFDEIVAFSEVEKFLDTPVKRYSSGMYVRLAFAVAAHLEPDILIVDEVLAVGDAAFQKKCLGKMKDVSGEGRTIIFVSHNMETVQNLCDKAIYLDNGKVQLTGDSDKVISAYLKASLDSQSINLADRKDRMGNGVIRFKSVELKDEEGNILQALQCGKKGAIQIHFDRKDNKNINNLHIAFGIDDEFGQRVSHFSNEVTNQVFNNVHSDCIKIIIDKVPLKKGNYAFTLYSTVNGELADYIIDAGNFEVEAGDYFNTGKLPPEGQGNVYINHTFQIIN